MASKPTSTGFINLREYLRANSSAADTLGQRLASGLDEEGARARGLVQATEQGFQSDAGAKMPSNGFAPDDAMLDPTDPANAEYAKRAKEMTTAQYAGPRGLEENSKYGEAASAVSAGQKLAASMGNEYGRASLLQQRFGAPSYSGGQAALDSFLAGASPGGGAAVRKASSGLSGLREYLAGAKERAKDTAAAGDKRAADMRAEGQRRLDYRAPVQTAPAPEPVEADPNDRLEDKRERANRYRRDRDRYYTP